MMLEAAAVLGGDEGQARVRPPHDYLIAKRNLRLPFMEVFDAPDTLLSLRAARAVDARAAGARAAERQTSNDQAEAFAGALLEGSAARQSERSTARTAWRPAARRRRRERRWRCSSWRECRRSRKGRVRARPVQPECVSVRELREWPNMSDSPATAASF